MMVMTAVSSNLNWGGGNWRHILGSDAKGYYAYLPAVFIYHDLNFGFFDAIEKEEYHDPHLYYDYRAEAHGARIDKYYAGTALAELPFFLAAHGLTLLSGGDADGYSSFYLIAVNIAALFYLFIGLLFLDRSLARWSIGSGARAVTLVATVFGTNLFYYSTCEPGMSHVYSFAAVSVFIRASAKYFSRPDGRMLVLMAALLGLIVLIRPVNGLIVLAWPFVAGGWRALWDGLAFAIKRWDSAIAGLAVFTGIVAVQGILYVISTGHFFVDSYTGEGIDLFAPHVVDMLFSYKKGLFLYTPMYVLALVGGYHLWCSGRFVFVAWAGCLLVVTYVLSSWSQWYYGGSFSSRVFVEYLPLFMIPLGMAVQGIVARARRALFLIVVALLVVLCQVQTYQYRYYQIHWSDMTKEKYWNVFLRVDELVQVPDSDPLILDPRLSRSGT